MKPKSLSGSRGHRIQFLLLEIEIKKTDVKSVCFICEGLPKRSRIEVRKPKSTPLFLIKIDVQMLLKTKPFHNIVINNII